jgi:hypothetical protein
MSSFETRLNRVERAACLGRDFCSACEPIVLATEDDPDARPELCPKCGRRYLDDYSHIRTIVFLNRDAGLPVTS